MAQPATDPATSTTGKTAKADKPGKAENAEKPVPGRRRCARLRLRGGRLPARPRLACAGGVGGELGHADLLGAL